jgi:hypothetical protein
MGLPANREDARKQVAALVKKFQQNLKDYVDPKSSYNETQARTDFISPLLECLGWDVYNNHNLSLDLREVIEEPTVEVGPEKASKKPDYELRLARQRKLFVEAKKPSVKVENDRAAAFQTRRYGFSASLPISVLTNFHRLVIYDCLPTPAETDQAHVARVVVYEVEEFEKKFDEIYDLISREAIYSGAFDKKFKVGVTHHGTQQFDTIFLKQVRSWRERLAHDILKNKPTLTADELTYAVQLFLSRLVFLRICEDRDIEKYDSLRALEGPKAFEGLIKTLERADAFYDSGLFRLLEDKKLGITVSDETLSTIIDELYYPQSPYTFAVVETEVLGEIYELFLAEEISIDGSGNVSINPKPEVRESGGVFPTPRYIVDAIVSETIGPLLEEKAPEELTSTTFADICCGSGVFLLAIYEQILAHHLEWYSAHDPLKHRGKTIYEVAAGQWRLMFEEKRRILLNMVRGVDIDAAAVEVARFSLLLKLLEDETSSGLDAYFKAKGKSVLPALDDIIKCGNSLISHSEYSAHDPFADAQTLAKLNPFDWKTEFPQQLEQGGFDAIVGNPPYIRIQNMVEYSPKEVEFYQTNHSPYSTAASDNFDKYGLFVERSLTLVKPKTGCVGVIVPHKFMTTTAGRALRVLISSQRLLDEMTHFGAQQVFGTKSANYTCILYLNREGKDAFLLERVHDLSRWRYGEAGELSTVDAGEIGAGPWPIASEAIKSIVEQVRGAHGSVLETVADIFVGVQTSADKIYILHPAEVHDDYVVVEWNGKQWRAEREILRPCLHDVALHAYARPEPNSYMIFPYKIAGDKAILLTASEFKKLYPETWKYLSARKSELENRNIVGGEVGKQEWYQYGRSQSLTKIDGPKIILPALSREPRYAYDDENIVVTGGGNGPYYLIRPKPDSGITIETLLAVLCHPLSEAIIRSRTSVFRGGYYSHGKQFIADLPVPILSAAGANVLDKLVKNCIGVATGEVRATMPAARIKLGRLAEVARTAIEAKITEAFGLTDAEVEVLREMPIPE